MYIKCLILDIPELDPSKDMDPMADKVDLEVIAISLTSIQQVQNMLLIVVMKNGLWKTITKIFLKS